MTRPLRLLPALLATLAVAAGCSLLPGPTPTPSAPPASGPVAAATPPAASDRPFTPTAWPAAGTACTTIPPDEANPSADPAAIGPLLGRVEAVSEHVVRFTLCRPDGAFPARLTNPALGILDATGVEAVEHDPLLARTVAGAGAYRVRTWLPGLDVQLERVGDARPGARPPVIVLRWSPDPAARGAALVDAAVDGIDGPDASSVATFDTIPEIAITGRPEPATAYLGFGTGASVGVQAFRLAVAKAIDREALVTATFPRGSVVAEHLAPCGAVNGCAGVAWHELNAPAAVNALAKSKVDPATAIGLTIPDAPIPGLSDPAGVAAAIAAQAKDTLGLTLVIHAVPAADLAAAIAEGTVEDLFLGAVTSPVADAAGYLEPVFGPGLDTTAGRRAPDIAGDLATAAATGISAIRATALAAASDTLRAAVVLVPLAHTGTAAAFRADVKGATAGPLGADPLGAMRPADRRQLVFMGTAEPAAAWCGVASDASSVRLCGLTTPGLLALDAATGAVVPSLAIRCVPNDEATTWSCRLRSDIAFSDGTRLDAADVVATIRALADPAGALRGALPATAFSGFDALLGASADLAGVIAAAPTASPTPLPSPSPTSAGSTPIPSATPTP